MKIQGSVAFVTGANRGLGRQFAEQLLARGAKVYAGARNPETVTLGGVIPVRIDITDPASVQAAAELAADTTILVNNAGTTSYNGLLDGPMDDIRAQMESHFFGTLNVTRAFVPHLVANAPGAILNIASILSWKHIPGIGAYAAAKAALWAQTDAVREELAPKGVAVTGLYVGFMDTDMAAGVDAEKSDPAHIAAAALDGVEAGVAEVLGDEQTRAVKASLSA